MKTRKWGKTILAALLAVMMILPSVAAMADEPQSEADLGNVEYISIHMQGDGGVVHTDKDDIVLQPGASVTAGDVSETSGYDAVNIESYGGKASITVGNISYVSESEEEDGLAVRFETGEDAVITFISKDIVAEGNAVDIWNEGGTVSAQTGAIDAEGNGISIMNYGDGKVSAQTGAVTAVDEGVLIDSTAATETTVTADSVDVSASGNAPGGKIYGIELYGDGTVTMTVGDVSATAEDLGAGDTDPKPTGISIISGGTVSVDAGNILSFTNVGDYSESHGLTVSGENDAEISVTTENVTSSVTTENWAEGYGVEIRNEGKSTEVTTGDIAVTADGKNHADALGVRIVNEEITTEVTTGDIVATAAGENNVSAAGIFVLADNKSDTTITVNSITATATPSESEEGYSTATGAEIIVSGDATVDLTVAEGGIVVESGDAAVGIETINHDGTIMIDATGDIDSSGIGISLTDWADNEPVKTTYEKEIEHAEDDSHDDDRDDGTQIWIKTVDGVEVYYVYDPVSETIVDKWTYDMKDNRKGGETVVTVTGDVTADDTAIELSLTEAASTMEVTVDGTVEGKEHAIVLSEKTILSDKLTMTVWEVKPNEAGNIVEREESVETEDQEQKLVYKADKEAEKLIQYIIRVEDTSKDYIAAGSGATDFKAGTGETYKVAKEGEKVLVKLNIPEDKELVAAYWDKAKSEAGRLLQDAEGNYYLEIPRGGGVELSVTLKDIPKPEPDPDDKKYSVATPILTVWDADHKVEISFYASKKFVATMEDGSKEKGTYKQADGKIILVSGGSEITIADDGTFTYTSQNNASLSYKFDLTEGEMGILKAVK